MPILEFNDVEVDYCVSCNGIWLDEGELDLLFGDHKITQGFLTAGDSARAVKEAPRRCPICKKKMHKAQTGGAHPVLYDECPARHGLWFDEGELATVLEHGSTAAGSDQVVGWLREMFPQEGEEGE